MMIEMLEFRTLLLLLCLCAWNKQLKDAIESVGALIVSLIERAKRDCPLMQESFRRALLPAHRALADFMGFPPFEDHPSQSFHPRHVHVNSFRTLPSLHPLFYPRDSHREEVGCWPPHNITPPIDITPPSQEWPNSPLGFTSTPFRTPVVRPRPEQFALINQLLTAMRTSEESMARFTDQFADDPIFRERMLSELEELRTLVVAQPTTSAVSQTISNLLGRVEQAEITLSSLIQNLQQLQNITLTHQMEHEEGI